MARKKFAYVSFCSCEGCAMEFLHLLDVKPEKIKQLDIQSCRVLQEKNNQKNLDIAFAEGAIATPSELKRLKELRKNSKKLVVVGTCALSGWPSTQRNSFSPEQLKKFQSKLSHYGQLPKIQTVPESVKTDLEIPGCPVTWEQLDDALEKLKGAKK
ncbi:MAG: hypothetical protein V1847_01500 [Candidatus Diapherotrites archaeon]